MIRPLALVAALLGGWEAYVRLGGIDAFLLPAPTQVGEALWQDRGLLWADFTVTAREVLLGIVLALAVGTACALALHASRTLRRTAYPLLVASQAVPVVVLAPIFVIAFDYGIGPKVAIVALISFFPVTVNVLDGLRSADSELLKLMRSLGASRLTTLGKAELPASLPYFFSGLRVAATVSVIGAVFGEWAGADEGLGRLVLLANTQLETPRLYAGVVLLALMAVALFVLVTLVERLAVPWNRAEAGP